MFSDSFLYLKYALFFVLTLITFLSNIFCTEYLAAYRKMHK